MRQFYRLSGGGNDFLALVEPASEPGAEEIRLLCCRGLSAGADGLFILDFQPPRISMRYFNADGHLAELCLNGTRCAIRLAYHLGWAEGATEITTGAGTFTGRKIDANLVALDLPRPDTPRAHSLVTEDEIHNGWRIEIGVPHFVLPWNESLRLAPVAELGPRLRHHVDWGDRGSNINFARYVDLHQLELRTYERGVEAETLACGTGVMASTAVGLETGHLELPVRVLTLGGFELEVARSGDDLWSLAGDARLIAEGTLHPGARELPPPPTWSP